MAYSKQQLWQRFQKYYTEFPALGLALELSRMNFPDDFLAAMEPRMQTAFAEMAELERGAIANPDEKRMVGHYWLRNPALAPTSSIRSEIEEMVVSIKAFASDIHNGKIAGAKGPFKNLLHIGIGGSALGPQFVSHALGQPGRDKLSVYLFDNTDPDGFDNVLSQVSGELDQTICVVVSKSGGTQETRNGMLEAAAGYKAAGLNFGQHAVAITSRDSELDKQIINLQRKVTDLLVARAPAAMSAHEIADAIQAGEEAETVFCICDRLAANPDQRVQKSVAAAFPS